MTRFAGRVLLATGSRQPAREAAPDEASFITGAALVVDGGETAV
jgi:hypothetical protein